MKLLDHFGYLSQRRFITFFRDVFLVGARRRRLEGSQTTASPAMMRGALMRAVRQPDPKPRERELQCGTPLLWIELTDEITITFDYNFGEGNKDLLFGLMFKYPAGDDISNSIQGLLRDFISLTLGSLTDIFPDMPDLGGFSFVDTAEDLANDLIRSLVIDVAVDLDFLFVVDLNPTFDPYAISRIPNFHIQINHFDMQGAFGVNDWTTALGWSGVELAVSQAKAMVGINSTLSSFPIIINSSSELLNLVNPPSEDSDRILFDANLEVDFPLFFTYQGIGAGSRIEYM